jgi:hypothetical protein
MARRQRPAAQNGDVSYMSQESRILPIPDPQATCPHIRRGILGGPLLLPCSRNSLLFHTELASIVIIGEQLGGALPISGQV